MALPVDLDVFELAAIGMVLTDRLGHLRRVNPAFCELLGRSSDELVGASFSSMTSPDDIATSQDAMSDLLTQAATTARFEKRCVGPDGSHGVGGDPRAVAGRRRRPGCRVLEPGC